MNVHVKKLVKITGVIEDVMRELKSTGTVGMENHDSLLECARSLDDKVISNYAFENGLYLDFENPVNTAYLVIQQFHPNHFNNTFTEDQILSYLAESREAVLSNAKKLNNMYKDLIAPVQEMAM